MHIDCIYLVQTGKNSLSTPISITFLFRTSSIRGKKLQSSLHSSHCLRQLLGFCRCQNHQKEEYDLINVGEDIRSNSTSLTPGRAGKIRNPAKNNGDETNAKWNDVSVIGFRVRKIVEMLDKGIATQRAYKIQKVRRILTSRNQAVDSVHHSRSNTSESCPRWTAEPKANREKRANYRTYRNSYAHKFSSTVTLTEKYNNTHAS